MRLVNDSRGDVDPVRAAQFQRVRGDLHRARDVAAVEHLAERALEVDRLRRRPDDRPLLAAHDRLDRAEQPARQPGALEQRADEERGRGLAVRARDAGDLQRRRRIAVEPRRGRAIAARTSLHHHLGHAEPERARDDERRRPARDRVGSEVVPVAGEAGHAEEQGPGTDEPVIEGQARDDHVGPVPEQLAERHAARSLRTGPAARMLPMPDRRTLTDTDGTPIATYTDVERDGRRVADLLELEVPVERALQPILDQLKGYRVAGPVELGRALIEAGGTPARHAHVYSHDLAERPEPTIPPRDHAHPAGPPRRGARAGLPGRAPAGPPRLPGDRRRGQRRVDGRVAGRQVRPDARQQRARDRRRRRRRRDPDRRPGRPRPAVRGAVGDGAVPRPGSPRRRPRPAGTSAGALRAPRSASPSRRATRPRGSTSGSASGSC